jgi:YHS domain-containing protein
VKGQAKWSTTRDGHTWWFADAEAKQMFDAAPDKYAMGYEGWCATAVAYGKLVPSDPTLFTVYQGRTYLFANADAKKAFDADPAGMVAKVNASWPKLHP